MVDNNIIRGRYNVAYIWGLDWQNRGTYMMGDHEKIDHKDLGIFFNSDGPSQYRPQISIYQRAMISFI